MKIARIAVVIAALVAGGTAMAAATANLDVWAQMGGNLSVSASGTLFDFGTVAPNTQYVNGTAVVVTNDSSGFVEDYTIQIVNSADWSAAAGNGADTANIRVLFNAAAPIAADFAAQDDLIGGAGAVLAGSLAGEAFVGDQTGQDVAPLAARNLWCYMQTPTSDSSSGANQRFVITITAVAP
jgi:hypothetical protein